MSLRDRSRPPRWLLLETCIILTMVPGCGGEEGVEPDATVDVERDPDINIEQDLPTDQAPLPDVPDDLDLEHDPDLLGDPTPDPDLPGDPDAGQDPDLAADPSPDPDLPGDPTPDPEIDQASDLPLDPDIIDGPEDLLDIETDASTEGTWIEADVGGEVPSSDGQLRLVVPAGALAVDALITVTLVPETDWPAEVIDTSPASPVYAFEPDGLEFLVPAELLVTLSSDQTAPLLAQGYPGLDAFSRDLAGTVTRLDETTVSWDTGADQASVAVPLYSLSWKWVGSAVLDGEVRLHIEREDRTHYALGQEIVAGLAVENTTSSTAEVTVDDRLAVTLAADERLELSPDAVWSCDVLDDELVLTTTAEFSFADLVRRVAVTEVVSCGPPACCTLGGCIEVLPVVCTTEGGAPRVGLCSDADICAVSGCCLTSIICEDRVPELCTAAGGDIIIPRCDDLPTASDEVDHCGGCGIDCDAGHVLEGAVCEAGTCVYQCDPAWGDCTGGPPDHCQTPLGTDDDCASCDDSCTTSDGEHCHGDEVTGYHCVCGDSPGEVCGPAAPTCCAGACVDTDLDPAHCGGCGLPCLPGETCASRDCSCAGNGSTACTPGPEGSDVRCCDTGCIDVAGDDDSNCGGCGQICASTERLQRACQDGVCQVTGCQLGFDDCVSPADDCETILGSRLDCSQCDDICDPASGEECLGSAVDGFSCSVTITPPEVVSVSAAFDSERPGCIAIDYSVRQDQDRPADLTIEVAPTGSSDFIRAGQAASPPGSGFEGISGLGTSADPGGSPHRFLWSPDQLPPGVTSAQVRLRASVGPVQGSYGTTIPIDLSPGITFERTDHLSGPDTGYWPSALAMGDLDGDLAIDMVASNTSGGILPEEYITVFIADGAGDFPTHRSYLTGGEHSEPTGIALGRFDANLSLDAAVAQHTGAVISTHFNDGDGSLADYTDWPEDYSLYSAAPIAVGDLNGDGHDDIAVAGASEDWLKVMLGAGDGTFGIPQVIDEGGGQPRLDVDIAEVDGGGLNDIAVINSYGGSVELFINETSEGGTEIVMNPLTITLGDWDSWHTGVAVGNFNGDAIPDLAVSESGTDTRPGVLFLLTGTGTAGSPDYAPPVEMEAGHGTNDVAALDVDADGDTDLAVVNLVDDTLVIFTGDGTGNFERLDPPLATQSMPIDLVAADLNGDHRDEIAVRGYQHRSIAIYSPHPGTRPPCEAQLPAVTGNARAVTAGRIPSAMAIVDLNLDGKPDLAAVSEGTTVSGEIGLWLGDGGGGMRPTFRTFSPTGARGIAVADLNGDALPDAVVSSAGLESAPAGDLLLFRGNGVGELVWGDGSGGFYPEDRLDPEGLGTSALALADVDGDGRPDLMAANTETDTVCVSLNLTDWPNVPDQPLHFGEPVLYDTGDAPVDLLAGDLDSDGWNDLVTVDREADGLTVRFNNRLGLFGQPTSLPVGMVPGDVTVADLDDDGRLDLITATAAAVTVWFGAPGRSFARRSDTGIPGAQPVALAAGDLDGDGDTDLAVAEYGQPDPTIVYSRVWTLLNDGSGAFGLAGSTMVGLTPSGVALTDIDGNGTLDLVVAAGGSNHLSLHLGLGDGEFETWSGPMLDTLVGPSAVVLGHFDDDEQLDLAAARAAALSILRGQGGGVLGEETIRVVTTSGPVEALAVADVDEVNGPDLIAVSGDSPFSGGSLAVVTADGLGDFNEPVETTIDRHPWDLAMADMDGDGHLDAVLATWLESTIDIFRNDPGALGSFGETPVASISLSADYAALQITAVDLNADGRVDLVATISTSDPVQLDDHLRVYQNTTTTPGAEPTFELAWDVPVDFPHQDPIPIAAGELDGTNGPDLVVGVAALSTGPLDVVHDHLLVWLNSTSGEGQLPRFTAGPVLETGYRPIDLALADLDGDTILDLAAINESSDTLALFSGLGNGWFEPAGELCTPNQPVAVATGDLDGDERLDLAVASRRSDRILIVLSSSPQ